MEGTNRRALNAPGLRVTNQRASILEIIRHVQGHLDVDEIYRRARNKQPQLSLSTVYRTLRMFKKLGLVEEVHFDEKPTTTMRSSHPLSITTWYVSAVAELLNFATRCLAM